MRGNPLSETTGGLLILKSEDSDIKNEPRRRILAAPWLHVLPTGNPAGFVSKEVYSYFLASVSLLATRMSNVI